MMRNRSTEKLDCVLAGFEVSPELMFAQTNYPNDGRGGKYIGMSRQTNGWPGVAWKATKAPVGADHHGSACLRPPSLNTHRARYQGAPPTKHLCAEVEVPGLLAPLSLWLRMRTARLNCAGWVLFSQSHATNLSRWALRPRRRNCIRIFSWIGTTRAATSR